MWSVFVCFSAVMSCDTKAGSLEAKACLDSSAILGWNSKLLLFNVWGNGVGSGSSGNTAMIASKI